MSDLKPATKIDPNVWYQLTEAAVDDYEGDFVSSLQPVAQDSESPEDPSMTITNCMTSSNL